MDADICFYLREPWITIHALCLLAVPVVTLAVCLLLPRRRPSIHQAGIAAILVILTVFIVLTFSFHLCHAGDPVSQCIIIGACLWFVLTYVSRKRLRRGLSVAMVIVMAILSWHYVALVHEDGWTGNTGPSTRQAAFSAVRDACANGIKEKIKESSIEDETIYPAGWLCELPFANDLKDDFAKASYLLFRAEVYRAWHSRFSHLYRVNRISQDIWYPGGKIADTVDSICLKDSP